VWQLVLTGVVFGGLELLYFAANVTKIPHGGWLPLLIAAIVVTVMTTWQRGRQIVTGRRIDLAGPLDDFVQKLHDDHVARVPGIAVFPPPTSEDGIVHVTARFGFQDAPDIPQLLRDCRSLATELDLDVDTASYFLSRLTIERGGSGEMASWRTRLFIGLSHNAATPAAFFKLPLERTVVMGSRIEI